MNKDKIKELRAHAGKLVAEGKPLGLVFEYCIGGDWFKWEGDDAVPDFADGDEWQIAKPKKQIIKWEHPYFKGCATNYGELYESPDNAYASTFDGTAPKSALRLATPATDDSNWQYFRSTPENDAKLRELAKMVKVEVRMFNDCNNAHDIISFDVPLTPLGMSAISNFRITGECQYGWTDKPEEKQS